MLSEEEYIPGRALLAPSRQLVTYRLRPNIGMNHQVQCLPNDPSLKPSHSDMSMCARYAQVRALGRSKLAKFASIAAS